MWAFLTDHSACLRYFPVTPENFANLLFRNRNSLYLTSHPTEGNKIYYSTSRPGHSVGEIKGCLNHSLVQLSQEMRPVHHLYFIFGNYSFILRWEEGEVLFNSINVLIIYCLMLSECVILAASERDKWQLWRSDGAQISLNSEAAVMSRA